MANKNKMSIYMIKDDFKSYDEIVEKFDNKIELEGIGTTFIGNSHASTPSWANFFFNGQLDTSNIFTANARVVTLITVHIEDTIDNNPVTTKTFAIVMGYGKNMLKDNVIEERFGLKVILNTIKPDSLRRISKVNIGGNQKLSNEQLPLKSDISDFGLDINRDLVSNITGISDDDEYVSGMMSGGDILNVTAEVDISNIIDFLKKTYNKYKLKTYTKNFAWIDQIQDVKDTRVINMLNGQVLEAINNSSKEVWMAVPEVIDWTDVKGFKYAGIELMDDIYIEKVRDSFREPLLTIEQLKNKRITAISALDDSQKYNWSAIKCLFGELSIDGKAYCLNNGKWYCINTDFVNQINDDYKQTPISTIIFDDYTDAHFSERSYSESFTKSHTDNFILMDAKNISYGGGHSSVELCDILSSENELIHIKPYSGSSTLSHLFNQAVVSAELIKSDASFLQLANGKILEVTQDNKFLITDRNMINVVFGIISKDQSEIPHIPFFSKVSLRYTKRRLRAFGYHVSIKNICKVNNVYQKAS